MFLHKTVINVSAKKWVKRTCKSFQEHIKTRRRKGKVNTPPPNLLISLPTAQTESLDEETLDAKVLLLGTCGAAAYVSYFPENCKIDHILWHSGQLLPDIAVENYDIVAVDWTLRFFLEAGSEAVGAKVGLDMLWARLQSDDELKTYFASCKELIDLKVATFATYSKKTKVIFLSFLESVSNPMGYLSPRFSLKNPAYFVMKLNEAMSKAAALLANAYYLDINEILNSHGKLSTQDDSVLSIAHASYLGEFSREHHFQRLQQSTPISQLYQSIEPTKAVFQGIAQRIIDVLKIINQSNPIKIIITDLDDTIWRGVAADDSSPDSDRIEGWPLGYIEALLVFKARGGLLAIASKNDDKETRKRFNRLLGRYLSLDDFVAIKINFEPKSKNIAQILQEVNILPSNALFIDDNPREIDQVKHHFPDIRTLSREHYDWRRAILNSISTQINPVHMKPATKKKLSYEEWLLSLNLTQHHVLLKDTNHPHFQRAIELVNTTNQFNTTGRRWEPAEIASLFDNGGFFVCAFLKDRTIDNGLVAVSIVRENIILQVVLSHQVFGLGIEYAMGRLVSMLILENHDQIKTTIEDSGKNSICHSYFKDMGFRQEENDFYGSIAPENPKYIHLDLSIKEHIE